MQDAGGERVGGSGGEVAGELAEDLMAQGSQGVFDLAAAVTLVDESGQGQPAGMLAGGLAAQPGPVLDLPQG